MPHPDQQRGCIIYIIESKETQINGSVLLKITMLVSSFRCRRLRRHRRRRRHHHLLKTLNLLTLLLFSRSPGQEWQQIFKARSPVDTETIKTKVCEQLLFS